MGARWAQKCYKWFCSFSHWHVGESFWKAPQGSGVSKLFRATLILKIKIVTFYRVVAVYL